jgi:RHS repeat-associated protein
LYTNAQNPHALTGYTYDYMLKDHLGNTRAVLTEEVKQDIYPAVTFEDASLDNEQLYYNNADVERTTRPGAFNNNNTNGAQVQLLRKSTTAIGAGQLLKVMSGDKFKIQVQYYIPAATVDNNNANGLNSVLNSLLNILNGVGAPAAVKGEGLPIATSLNNNNNFTSFLQPQNSSSPSATPKAYLNILFFDEQFNYEAQSSKIIPAGNMGSPQQIALISPSDMPQAKKNGYVYIYVSNESNNLVYFDNLQVLHERSSLMEETHYYPWGIKMQGICSKAAGKLENKNLFNGGNEMQNKEFSDGSGLELYDAQYRMYDPQIGRFNRADPLADFYDDLSPYSFAFDNPILFNDPSGLSPENENGSQAYTGYIKRTDGTIYFDPNVHDQKDLDPKSGLTYLGERLKTTDKDGKSTWWDENGQSSTTDPGWENLEEVTVTGTRQRPRDFGFYLDKTNYHYNGVKDFAEAGVAGLATIKRGTLVKNFYDLNKAYKYYNDVNLLKPGLAGTKVINGIKGAGKLVKRLGPVGNLLTAGNIAYEIKTDSWDAHTVIDGAILGTTLVVAAVAAAPIVAAVAVGVAIYGALDYFFDIGDKADATIGRNGSLWKND